MKHARAALVTTVFLAALPFGARGQEPQKVTIDTSGWFILQSFYDDGPMNSNDLPRWALTKDLTSSTATKLEDSQAGLAVRQSRFRMNVGIPSDGLLGKAVMKGLLEADFSGAAGSDVSAWLPRLRHAYVTATWKELNNLTLLVGQTWGVAPGPYFPTSITHLVVPRFGGAGLLFRRASQVRLTGDVPVATAAGVSATYTAAVVTPDNANGEKSTMPNLEGRVAGQYKMNGKQMVDVGLFGHFGKEKWATYALTGTGPTTSAAANGTKTLETTDLTTQVLGVDLKIDVPYVSLVAMYWQAKNADAYYTTAPGVVTQTSTDTSDTACGTLASDGSGYCTATGQTTRKPNQVVTGIADAETKGYLAQATITPVKGLQFALGYGVEQPDKDSLFQFATVAAKKEQLVKNQQLSGGVIYNISSKWRIGLEFTQYKTDYDYKASTADPVVTKSFTANQIELGTLLAL